MKVVLQRVRKGSVEVGGEEIAAIGPGLVILLGIGPEDNQESVEDLARKTARLRIFEDSEGKMNLSVLAAEGEILVVPQFTLYADTSRGNRPSFTGAAAPDLARKLVDHFCSALEREGVPTQSGKFGAHMLVSIDNDGPVTIQLES
jgi:D-tyrosyl-tRNA(Tyr) deacylase